MRIVQPQPNGAVKTMLLLLSSLLLMCFLSSTVGAEETHLSTFLVPYRSYTYNYWGRAVIGPLAYLPKRVVTAAELGIDSLREPKDFVVDSRNHIYICDTGNNRIIHLDSEWNLVEIIDRFINDGKEDTFSKPNSLTVTPDQHIYIADTGNSRIVHLDQVGNLVRVYGKPQAEGIFSEGFLYRPLKVGVNDRGHLFILAQDYFEGFITLDADGVFTGLIGAPRVSVSLADYIWFLISTPEQRMRQSLFLPTEYSGFAMDEQGFLYATVISDEGDLIRRLSPAGVDSLRRTGFHQPIGDIEYANMWQQATYYGRAQFVDVATLPYGAYSVVDRVRSRIYTYDNDGNLLYMFGYRGRSHGEVAKATAIEYMGLDLLVLDDERGQIVIFEPTEYVKTIWEALVLYNRGKYLEAEQVWRKILELNVNYDLAYAGIGRSMLLQDRFEEAMYYFKLGNDRAGYSQAFQEYRKIKVTQYFGLAMSVIVVAVIALALLRRSLRRRVNSFEGQVAVSSEEKWLTVSSGKTIRDKILTLLYNLKYSLYVIFHPFEGFHELKYKNRGSLPAAFIILIVLTITYTLMRKYTGFVFNTRDPSRLNVMVEIASVFVPFALWVGVNWAITTLMDGKGSLRAIIIASAYALVPLILINLPLTFISNFMILEEAPYYYLFGSIAVLWSLVLMFFGAVMTTHEYSFARSIFTTVFTLVSMVFAVFLALALLNLLELVVRFGNEVVAEIFYRV